MSAITAVAVDGFPEVQPGDDLAALIAAATDGASLTADDVIVIAHKIVSKAEAACA